MHYTYILESLNFPDQRYIGFTSNLKNRLTEHNSGQCRHTAKFKPWKLRMYFAFDDELIAQCFEKYLKSGSGHAFANRHFQ